jgi:hypothetical protein
MGIVVTSPRPCAEVFPAYPGIACFQVIPENFPQATRHTYSKIQKFCIRPRNFLAFPQAFNENLQACFKQELQGQKYQSKPDIVRKAVEFRKYGSFSV